MEARLLFGVDGDYELGRIPSPGGRLPREAWSEEGEWLPIWSWPKLSLLFQRAHIALAARLRESIHKKVSIPSVVRRDEDSIALCRGRVPRQGLR